MFNKKIYLIILVLLSTSCFASTPDFAITELFKNEVKNGNNDLGNLLFIEKPYITENHNMFGFENISIQQYDTINWKSDKQAEILITSSIKPILVNGSKHYFTTRGTFKIQSYYNESIYSFINVLASDINQINITDIYAPTGFNFTLSDESFILNDEKTLTAGLEVDEEIEKGDYKISYRVNEIKHEKTIKVLENINWTHNDSNLTKQSIIKSGEGKYLGRIVLENKGNTNVNIRIIKKGNNTGLINIPQPQTLFKKNIINLDFQAQIPTTTKSGLYEMEIQILGNEDDDKIKKIPINITVIDSINPVIESINFSTDKAFLENDLRCIATDNNDVTNFTLEYDGKIIEFEKDANLFTKKITFDKLSRYVLKFCAYDKQENKECLVLNKTFKTIPVVEGNQKVLNMDSMKFGKYSRIELFNITQDLNETYLEIVDFSTSNNKDEITPIFRIVDDEGSIRNFDKYDRQVKITSKGEYHFEVRADIETKVDGILRLIMPPQYEEIEDITFKVDFKDYDVPHDFSVAVVGDKNLFCKVEDTGNLETSFYDCNIKYDIKTRQEDISIPTTVNERNIMEQKADVIREELEETKNKNGWIIGFLSSTLFLVIGWAIFMVKYYPYLRFTIGRKKD